jgi:hypothetical protein
MATAIPAEMVSPWTQESSEAKAVGITVPGGASIEKVFCAKGGIMLVILTKL